MGTLLLGEIESSLLQGYFGELRTKEVVVREDGTHPGAQPEKADGEESAALQPGIIVV